MKWSSCLGGSQVRQGIRLMRSGWKSGRGAPALGRHGTGTFVRMVDDVVRGDVFRFRLIREQDAVAQDVMGKSLMSCGVTKERWCTKALAREARARLMVARGAGAG